MSPAADKSADSASEWFAAARSRWPDVQWPIAAYRQHLRGESPPHPLDLFLTGAAGHRIESAWEAIEQDMGPRTRAVLTRQPIADFSVEELWAETIGRLISPDAAQPSLPSGQQPAYILRYRGLVGLVNYLILVAKRLAIQRNRQSRPLLSIHHQDTEQSAHDVIDDHRSTPAESAEDAEQGQALQRAVGGAYASLSADQQFLIAMVYRNGMKQKEAGALLGWSEFKTCRSLSSAMGILRKAMEQWAGTSFGGAMAAAWEGALASCWQRIPEPGPGQSGGARNRAARV